MIPPVLRYLLYLFNKKLKEKVIATRGRGKQQPEVQIEYITPWIDEVRLYFG